jgi:hypothetical protein
MLFPRVELFVRQIVTGARTSRHREAANAERINIIYDFILLLEPV